MEFKEQEYLSMWKGFQKRKEDYYTRQFYNALQMQVEQFRKTGNVGSITSYPIYKVLTDLFKKTGVEWAHKSYLNIRSQKARLPMGFSERIVELMRQYYGIDLLNDAELMTAYSREVIVTVLSEAAQTGLSFSEIVSVLTKHPEFTAVRARRIARTETVTAANNAAMINAKESGLALSKKWLSIVDNRTRRDHLNVNGKTLDIDEPYNVGGALMQNPGARKQDNGLPTPAKEVVNCRCTQALIPKRDARGRIIIL